MKKIKWEIIDDVPKFPNGGATNPPIYVNDPKDPRLKLYADSSDAYNYGLSQEKSLKKINETLIQDYNNKKSWLEPTATPYSHTFKIPILDKNHPDYAIDTVGRTYKGILSDYSIAQDYKLDLRGKINNINPTRHRLSQETVYNPKGDFIVGSSEHFPQPKQPYIFDKNLTPTITSKLTPSSKLIPDKSKGYGTTLINIDSRGKKGNYDSTTNSIFGELDKNVEYEKIGESLYKPIGLIKKLVQPYIYKRQQEETIPFNKMGLENLDPLQSMQKVPEPNPITSVPKDYVTIKTGSSYRNPDTGVFEQKSFKIDKVTGKRILGSGGATERTIRDITSGSKNNPITLPEVSFVEPKNVIQKPNIVPNYIAEQDATYRYQPIADKLNFQGIKLNTQPKVNIANVQKKLKDLKLVQDSMGSLNGGLGPSNFFDMLKQLDRGQEMGNLESKYQNQLPYKPLLNKADAVGTTMLTVGKYFAPPQVRQGIDYSLNAQDIVELYNNPTDTLNQASVASDALSFIKSKKTGFAPFNYAGDLITLKQKYDLFNKASNQTYQNGGQTKSNWQIIEY